MSLDRLASASAAGPAKAPFRYVDLFAGIGGFAAALSAFGGRGVYAVENDRAAARVYDANWHRSPLAGPRDGNLPGTSRSDSSTGQAAVQPAAPPADQAAQRATAYGDITHDANDEVMTVPEHDLLAGGFPCQPFSKSGAQLGMEETRGTLYWNILRIIDVHRPVVVLLENVRNIAGERHRHEWDVIIATLRQRGYRVADDPAVFSPHLLPPARGGRPQVRERVFITATHDPKGIGQGPVYPAVSTKDRVDGWDPQSWDLLADLPVDDHDVPGTELSAAEVEWVNAWDEWVRLFIAHTGRQPPGHPIWADEWVPDDDKRAARLSPLDPPWKQAFVRHNQVLYTQVHHGVPNRVWIDRWVEARDVRSFPPSRRKLEWQAQGTPRLWDCVMHLRPSGIRAKRPTYVPALVAITQTSIVPLPHAGAADERAGAVAAAGASTYGVAGVAGREVADRRMGDVGSRRLSPREAARLQGLPDGFSFAGQRDALTYKQLGNGVNVGVVWHVLKRHVDRDRAVLEDTETGRALLTAVDEAPDSPDGYLLARFPAATARGLPSSRPAGDDLTAPAPGDAAAALALPPATVVDFRHLSAPAPLVLVTGHSTSGPGQAVRAPARQGGPGGSQADAREGPQQLVLPGVAGRKPEAQRHAAVPSSGGRPPTGGHQGAVEPGQG